MDIEKAKKLMALQSCITYFCDEFLNEASLLPSSEIKESLIEGMKEVVGVNFTEAMLPIISRHSSLNPYGDNSITNEWFKTARKNELKYAANNSQK